MRDPFLPRIFLYLLMAVCVAANLAGMFTPFFTDDPALYASIAKELVYRRSFFELFSYGQHWLDKPHFPFWMAFFSFRIFGISDWAYKLPALLFFCMSLFYTGIFTRRFYDRDTALVAVLMVSTALHILLSNTDVRAEPYLMGLLIGAVYHLARLNHRFSWFHLVLSALFAACAVMTKGVFILVALGGAVAGHLIFSRRAAEMLRLKWLGVVLLTLLFITPELYALYAQFDAHPERTVFQRQGVSGIRFFLWDSQFGRFFNSGPIVRQKGSIWFFAHTLLWAFAPWCLLFFYALLKNCGRLLRGIRLNEYYTFCGGVLLLLLFSFSGFQLPFYTNILFPFFAVFTAPLLTGRLRRAELRLANISMGLYASAFIAVMLVLQVFFLDEKPVYPIALALFFAALVFYVSRLKFAVQTRLFVLCCLVMVLVQIFCLVSVYPLLLRYKGEIAAADYVNKAGRNKKIFTLSMRRNIFQFYCNREVLLCQQENFGKRSIDKNAWYFADEMTVQYLLQNHMPFRLVRAFENNNNEVIRPDFIRPASRRQTLSKLYLLAPAG